MHDGERAKLEILEAALRLARQYGVTRLRLPDLVEFELATAAPVQPEVPAQEVPVAPPAPDEDRCPCGHSLEVEHSPSGCLYGCSVKTCLAEEPDARPAKA
jgi:hypothetical protein